MHYLDNAATTRVLPEAAEAAVHAMCEEFGNPSSLHRMGLEASHLLEDSRRTVASALGCLPEEVYFTACGTESTNISLRGAAHLNRHKKGRIITTEIEHAATVNTAKQLAADGFDVVFLAPDATGHITPEVLSEALTEDTILLSCQLVNNEIGTVQPVEQLGKLLKAKAPKALFHIDAVQGLCRVRLTPKKWNCDLMSVSGHKIGAPKGIGALYVKKGLRLPPLTFGGGQERGMRPGTEAVPNIAAFAKACEIRMAHFDEDYAHVQELADYLKQQVSAELVKPDENHDFSLLSVILAAGEIDKSVLKKLKKLSDERKYQSGKHGWSSIRLAVVDLDTHKVHTNRMGDSLKNILQPLV